MVAKFKWMLHRILKKDVVISASKCISYPVHRQVFASLSPLTPTHPKKRVHPILNLPQLIYCFYSKTSRRLRVQVPETPEIVTS